MVADRNPKQQSVRPLERSTRRVNDIFNKLLEQKLKFQGILRRKNVQEIAPHMRITDRASTIREKHKIKTPDAIHLATAILFDVDEMHTMDGWHEDGKRDGLLALSGNVADYKLRITEPYPRGTPPALTATPSEAITGEQDSLFKEMLEEELESEDDKHNGTTEESNELQADPTHPASLQGSDSGRAQSEATGESPTIPQRRETGENKVSDVIELYGNCEASKCQRGDVKITSKEDLVFVRGKKYHKECAPTKEQLAAQDRA
jgi:hypothetical protein